MSEKFVGSGLVTQLNEGHCSISAVSACTLEAATAYFREGKLPRNGKISCSVDEKPWKPLDGQLKIKRVDSKTEKDSERAERVGAWKEMQQVFAKQGLWQV